MDIKEFKSLLFDKANAFGFTQYDIFYNSGESFEVSVFEGEVDEYKNTAHKGFGFRGMFEGKIGYAYSEQIDESVIDFVLQSAKDNAMEIENDEEKIYKGDKEYPQVDGVSPNLNIKTPKEKIDFAIEMEKAAFAADSRIVAVISSVVSTATGDTYIANSEGLELYAQEGYGVAYVYLNAKDGDSSKSHFEVWQGKDFEDFKPVELAQKAVKKVVSTLGAQSVQSKKYNIILENRTAIDLIGVYLSNFYAENVQKGFSLLAEKLGKEVASEIVNIYDNISHEKSITPLSFDSEGVAVKNKTIIEKGKLNSYFYNYKAALKDGVEPTGNGFKRSYKASVATSCANCFIAPGEKNFDELVKELGNGLIINSLAGLHSGCSPVSGDFSLLSEGFLVENGEIVKAVEQITIAGNFYDVLKNITGIGSDLEFDPIGTGGSLGSPSLIISDISVSGL